MADTKLSALTEVTALADTDELYVNDGGTSKRATVATLRSATNLNMPSAASQSPRYTGGRNPWLTLGPYQSFVTTGAVIPGAYQLAISYVRGGTPTSVAINVISTNTAGDEAYFVLMNSDSDGLPTTVANSWGPFDVATSGAKTLTVQTETITEGYWWVGIFCPTGNTSSPTFTGFKPALSTGGGGTIAQARTALISGDTGFTTPASIASFTVNATESATVLAPDGTSVALAGGWV